MYLLFIVTNQGFNYLCIGQRGFSEIARSGYQKSPIAMPASWNLVHRFEWTESYLHLDFTRVRTICSQQHCEKSIGGRQLDNFVHSNWHNHLCFTGIGNNDCKKKVFVVTDEGLPFCASPSQISYISLKIIAYKFPPLEHFLAEYCKILWEDNIFRVVLTLL